MAAPVFLSFDPEDGDLVSTFLVLAEKADKTIEFTDWSIKGGFNSPYGPYLRDRIRQRLSECSALICLLGESTWKDAWAAWEIQTAAEMGIGLVGVRLHNNLLRDLTPQALMNAGATPVNWVTSDVIAAIRKATGRNEAAA